MHRRPLKNPGTAQSGSGLGGCHHQFCHRKSDGHVISPSNHCQRGHFRCPEQKGSCSPPLGLLSLLCCSISQKKKQNTLHRSMVQQDHDFGIYPIPNLLYPILLPSRLCWCCMAPVCPPAPAAEVLRGRWAGTGCAEGRHLPPRVTVPQV